MKVIINGFMGGLGSAITRLANAHGIDIAAGIDIRAISGNPACEGTVNGGFPVYNDINECAESADVIIECSTATSVAGVMAYAMKRRLPVVICTTGLSEADNDCILHGSEEVPVFKSANMSVGVSLVRGILNNISDAMYGLGYDIEIMEKHHNKKLDAPSGTALMLADTINLASGGRYEYIFNRSGSGSGRKENEIGIHSMRGGTIFGEHSIIYAGRDEIIEIKHTAMSKDIFASGALKAAAFLTSAPKPQPGLYGMEDLLACTGEG